MNMAVRVFSMLVFLIPLLTGCSYNPFLFNNRTTGDATGALVGTAAGAGGAALLGGTRPLIALAGLGGGALGYYVTTLRYDSGGVIQGGGQVYKTGDLVGIYIPVHILFEPNTADFLPKAVPILDSAATVLKRYPNNNILVSGNSSGFSTTRWERQLSEKRAQRIAAYFWDAGINQFKDKSFGMRRLTYVGYGNYFPIATDYSNTGIRQNSRIQITSYPSNHDLGLDPRQRVDRNIGAIDEGTDNASQACGIKNEC